MPALIWLEAIELPRDKEEASKTSLIEACDAQFSIESRTEAIAANLHVFEPSKDFGKTLRNHSFGAGELHSERSDFH